jgi:hypothetical protein
MRNTSKYVKLENTFLIGMCSINADATSTWRSRDAMIRLTECKNKENDGYRTGFDDDDDDNSSEGEPDDRGF